MTRIVVTGAAGRMGRAIIGVITGTEGFELVGATEHGEHPSIGKDAGESAGVGKLGVKITRDFGRAIGKADAVIDFTSPDATMEHLEVACQKGVPMVIGATGLSHSQRDRMKVLGKTMSIMAAPNMSVGVNVLLKVVSDMAQILGNDYDIEIIEAHHRHKKDAPSGTALRLGEVIANSVERKLEDVAVYERHGIIGARRDDEIGIQTVRAGDIVGDHTVLFGGPGERIEVTHRAHSRDTFASGAVRAARWIVGQPDGLYDMQDVLGLKK
ncbi:MAG: 4-hydroxy-tetrahydrodipicolinate reductase [Thermodesulfobacteriota bacterium]